MISVKVLEVLHILHGRLLKVFKLKLDLGACLPGGPDPRHQDVVGAAERSRHVQFPRGVVVNVDHLILRAA